MKNYKARLPLPRLGMTGICLLSLPFSAQASDASQSVLSQLFAQAQYWHDRDHPDDAKSALNKVLSVAPDNAEALYLLALYAHRQGNKVEAERFKKRLQQVSPGDPRLAEIEERTDDARTTGLLARARLLASQGNPAAAVKVYESLFTNGQPGAAYTSEYYQTLAALPARRDEAITALRLLHQANPDNAVITWALARILTWRETTRRDGISLLQQISGVIPKADSDRRAALLWLHPIAEDKPLFDAWTHRHPDDSEIVGHFVNNVTGSRIAQGYETANQGNFTAADAQFQQALVSAPDNSNALGGLGVVAMRQENFSRAKVYFDRAAAQKGNDREKWQALADKAQFYLTFTEAKRRAKEKAWDSALAISAPLLTSDSEERRSVVLFRADVLRQKGDLAGAEQALRSLGDPVSDPSLGQALYYILKAGKKDAQAQSLLQSLPLAFRRQVLSHLPVSIQPQRLAAARARQSGDLPKAIVLLHDALQKDSANVWVRLDLARVLKLQGDDAQAAQVLMQAREHGPDGLYVTAIYAVENQRWQEALVYLDRIPKGYRNADMTALYHRASFNQRLAQADDLLMRGDNSAATAILTSLAKSANETPADTGHLASALYRAGLKDEAISLIHRNMHKGVKGAAGDYALQIEILNKAGLADEAQAWLSRPELLARTSENDLARLKSGVAINEADKLREQGKYAKAYDALIVKLQEDPHNQDLMLAMARVYQSGKMFDASRNIYRYVLAQDPNSQSALTGAINLALAEGDNQRAQTLLANLHDKHTPENLFLSARVARAVGNLHQSQALLRQARQQLIGISDREYALASNGMTIADNPFVDESDDKRSQSIILPWESAPKKTSSGTAGTTLLLTQVSDMLNETREKLSSWLESSMSLRHRDGESGLSALTETKTPFSFSTVPFGESRLKLGFTPVMLNAGSSTGQANNRFGSGALAQANASWQATQASVNAAGDSVALADAARKALEDKSRARIQACQDPQSSSCQIAMRDESDAQDAFNLAQQQIVQPHTYGPDDYAAMSSGSQRRSGIEIALSLLGDDYLADIGTTPLGQGSNNLVGGFRWSPKIAGNTQLTLNAERRAVTDSLLSYVGAKDKYSGERWGAVTKSGGGANLSYDNGDAGAYGGGAFYQYKGQNVPGNNAITGNVGFYVRPYHDDVRELKVGVNADYMNFSKNLSNFSFGQGGYFSPQDYFSLSFPVEYRQRSGNWNYKLSGAVGYQSYSQKESNYFPTRPDWQQNLDWLVDAGFGRESRYAARNDSGVSYNVRLQGDYRLNPQMSVGGLVGYDTTGEYSEANAMLYFKYLIDNK